MSIDPYHSCLNEADKASYGIYDDLKLLIKAFCSLGLYKEMCQHFKDF